MTPISGVCGGARGTEGFTKIPGGRRAGSQAQAFSRSGWRLSIYLLYKSYHITSLSPSFFIDERGIIIAQMTSQGCYEASPLRRAGILLS